MALSKIAFRLRGRPDSITFESGSLADIKRRADELTQFGMIVLTGDKAQAARVKPVLLRPGEIILTLRD